MGSIPIARSNKTNDFTLPIHFPYFPKSVGGAIAELERNLIIERVKAGMRRAKLEGQQIGRAPMKIDREQVIHDRRSGMSLRQVAEKHRISRASVCRLMKEANAASRLVNGDSVVPRYEEQLSANAA